MAKKTVSEERGEQVYHLAPASVARGFDRCAPGYDESAVLQNQVREQLLERLDLLGRQPSTVLDAGTGSGLALAPLRERFAGAELVGMDISPAMLAQAAPRAAGARLIHADCHDLAMPTGSVDLVFSNLMLPWCHDVEKILREFRRVLAPGGHLSFSTCGPDTLRELRRAWSHCDESVHVHYFYDMHDIGDALQRAGFAGPVMDVDYYTLTYADGAAMMRDLRASGAGNVAGGRRRGLTGRRRFEKACEALDAVRRDGRVPATFEIIYGHAFAPDAPAALRQDDGSVAVPVSALRRQGKR